MITKEQEYIAELLKIAGFALIAPFGKEFLTLPFLNYSTVAISHLLYIAYTFGLAIIGVTFFFDGCKMIRER